MRWYYWPDKAKSQEAKCFDKIQLNELIRLGNRVWVLSLMRLSCYEDVLVLFSVGCFTKSDQPAREPYIFGNCGRPAAKNTFQGFGQELSVEDIIAPLKGSLVLPKVCKKLFPRFGGEIKTGGWAGRGLPSWNKVQTNMHSHFQDWEKMKV